jgi:HEAT repeat protein
MVDSDQRLSHGTVLMAGLRRALVGVVLVWFASQAAVAQVQAPDQTPLPPSLRQAAQDVGSPEARVRRRALRDLREHGGPETLVLLGRLIRDQQLGIREDALDLVARIYVEPPAGQRIHTVEEAFGLGPFYVTPWPAPPELTQALVSALADDHASVRRDSAYVLAIVARMPASSEIAFELMASLSDRLSDVRLAAARALGRLRVTAAGLQLVGRINDEALDVRLAAMRALGDIRERSAVPALTEQFEFYTRGIAGRQALDALARIGDPRSVPLFETHRGSDHPERRMAAYEGLARSGAAKTTAGLEAELAPERDEQVRLALAFALASSGRSLAPIVEALAGEDHLRLQALGYLVELAPVHAAELQTRLRDPDPVVRQHVAVALGFLGGPETSQALAAAATDTNPLVRNAVQVAQLRLRSTSR